MAATANLDMVGHTEADNGPNDPLAGLVALAREGDLVARTRLLQAVLPDVRRYCRNRLFGMPNAADVIDDVVQEVALAVVLLLPRYRMQGSFVAYVQGIAAHKVADARRAVARSKVVALAEPPEQPVEHDGPEQLTLDREGTVHVQRLLSSLTPFQRQVITMRVLAGLTADEVGAALGTSANSVRVTQHRGLQRLRRRIEVG